MDDENSAFETGLREMEKKMPLNQCQRGGNPFLPTDPISLCHFRAWQTWGET